MDPFCGELVAGDARRRWTTRTRFPRYLYVVLRRLGRLNWFRAWWWFRKGHVRWLADLRDKRPEAARLSEDVASVEGTQDDVSGALPPLCPGTCVGSFRIVAALRAGGWRDSFLVRNEHGIEGVLKIVSPERISERWTAPTLEDEGDLLSASANSSVIRLLRRGRHGRLPYVIVEQVDGADLREIWNTCARKGIAFPVNVAVRIVTELADLVAAGARVGIVLGDLSPPNVALSREGAVKILSVAGARFPGARIHWSVYAKISYSSPELFSRAADERSEVFVLGILLWEMLTGHQMFPANDDVELRVRRAEIPRASTVVAKRVPRDLDRIVAKALARRPWRRYRTAAAFAEALRRCSAGGAAADEIAAFVRRVLD